MSLSDPLGINLTKELGHSIILDNLLTDVSIDITDDFFYNNNSITTGEIKIKDFGDSDINIRVSAWDNANNPTEAEIQLVLLKSNKLDILRVLNFPNPFSSSTNFSFLFDKVLKKFKFLVIFHFAYWNRVHFMQIPFSYF